MTIARRSPSGRIIEWDETASWTQGCHFLWNHPNLPGCLVVHAREARVCVCVLEIEGGVREGQTLPNSHQKSLHNRKVGENIILNWDSRSLFLRDSKYHEFLHRSAHRLPGLGWQWRSLDVHPGSNPGYLWKKFRSVRLYCIVNISNISK